MRMLDADRVHDLLDYAGLIEALNEGHLGSMPDIVDRQIYQNTFDKDLPDSFIIIPVWQPGEAILAKLTTVFPENTDKFGIPNVNSVYILLDGTTGEPRACIDGAAMILRKTSADSALGARYLAREDVKTLLMVGAGALAPHLVRAHLTVRPSLDRILIWNRNAARAQDVAKSLSGLGPSVDCVTDLDAALPEADIVSAATMATEPLVSGALLKPGAHVDLVGSFTPEMREADDDCLSRATIFVDHRGILERSGEFVEPLAKGLITPDDICGDLFELCQSKVQARTSADQITLMKNGGGGHLDYFSARHLLKQLAVDPIN